ncbi:MAG: thermonuclease family protein [Magnetococcales bacterium]|nr:thermonuclease family protein [Magnetococcales bacterium]
MNPPSTPWRLPLMVSLLIGLGDAVISPAHGFEWPGMGKILSTLDGKERVERIIDGDTFTLPQGKKVRVLGIDCPEVAKSGKPAEPLGNDAKKRAMGLLKGRSVTLSSDQDKIDDFKRSLAYVATEDGKDLGEILLSEGLAMVYVRPPNLSRAQRYLEIEDQARNNQLGIWSTKGGRRVAADRAVDHMDGYRVIHGQVTEVERIGHSYRIHFGHDHKSDFSISITERNWKKYFPAHEMPNSYFLKKTMEARGRISYEDGPSIHVSHPLQLKFLPVSR